MACELQTVLTVADVEEAARTIAGTAVETPLLEIPDLGRRTGSRVFVKCEMLQRTGSFKFRGAYNRLSQLRAEGRARGVVAFSSGNHGQAVAAAAALLGVRATIVMPSDAPAVKLARARAFGADVVLYDRLTEDRASLAGRIADEQGAELTPPYDDLGVMAGQGTIGLELCREAERIGDRLDAVLVPCGGGGLTAGIATAVHALSPATRVVVVEPESFDDTARSLAAGRRLANATAAGSICDSLLTPTPGKLTFEINRRHVEAAIAVSDDEVRAAMAYAFSELRLVIEPGGAVALAAILAGRWPRSAGVAALVLSGGNVDPSIFATIL